jgi:predicted Zn-dependent protease
VIKRKDLIRALGDFGLADWVVVERDQEIGVVDSAAGLVRSEHRLRWLLTVHHDAPAGRGSAHVSIDAASGDAEGAVREAVTLARASVGPAWLTQPAAAPARVSLEDTTLAAREPVAIASDLVQAAVKSSATSVQARGRVLRERVNVASRQGMRTEWTATHLRADLVVAANARSLRVTREARRLADLGLADAISVAAADIAQLAAAGPLAPGPCQLVLRADAMLHEDLGVWAAFIAQADAVVERQGLTRYRERMPIAEGAAHVAEPLSVVSDGALDLGLLSAPVGDQGDPVRRFSLVDGGIAAGLALTPREAALRNRDANGGVRNLVVATGTWSGTLDASVDRVVEVRRLRSLSLDPYTGDASLELALSIDHDKDGPKPTSGGSLRIDMIAALARARRSSTRLVRGAYVGPDAISIDGVEIIG